MYSVISIFKQYPIFPLYDVCFCDISAFTTRGRKRHISEHNRWENWHWIPFFHLQSCAGAPWRREWLMASHVTETNMPKSLESRAATAEVLIFWFHLKNSRLRFETRFALKSNLHSVINELKHAKTPVWSFKLHALQDFISQLRQNRLRRPDNIRPSAVVCESEAECFCRSWSWKPFCSASLLPSASDEDSFTWRLNPRTLTAAILKPVKCVQRWTVLLFQWVQTQTSGSLDKESVQKEPRAVLPYQENVSGSSSSSSEVKLERSLCLLLVLIRLYSHFY